MYRRFAAWLACSLVLWGAPSTGAQPLQLDPAVLTGTIALLDFKNLTVVLQKDNMIHAFSVTTPEMLEGLTKGDSIRVEVDERGKAKSIRKETQGTSRPRLPAIR